jgi:hypothetical protein
LERYQHPEAVAVKSATNSPSTGAE